MQTQANGIGCAEALHGFGVIARKDFDVCDLQLSRAAANTAVDVAVAVAQHHLGVCIDEIGGITFAGDGAMGQPNRAVAHVLHAAEIVRDQDDGAAVVAKLHELLEAALLERHVAHGQNLVDDEQAWIDVDRNSEGQTHVHARGVRLDRRVDEALEAGELDNLLEPLRDLAPCHSENRRVQKDVLATGELGMKAGTEFEQRRHALVHGDRTRVGLQDACHAFQQG